MLNVEQWKVGQTGSGVAKAGLTAKKTEPPKPYTEATLLADMKAAAKFIADDKLREALKEADGIGTPATRAAIIERIKEVGSIRVEKGKIRSTPEGRAIIHGLPDMLTNPGTTALWEEMLAKIATGHAPMEKFMEVIQAQVTKLVGEAGQSTIRIGSADKPAQVADTPLDQACPHCGGRTLAMGERWIKCSAGDFTLFREVFSLRLTDAQLLTLLREGRIGPVNGFKSARTKKTFGAVLVLQSDGRTRCEFV